MTEIKSLLIYYCTSWQLGYDSAFVDLVPLLPTSHLKCSLLSSGRLRGHGSVLARISKRGRTLLVTRSHERTSIRSSVGCSRMSAVTQDHPRNQNCSCTQNRKATNHSTSYSSSWRSTGTIASILLSGRSRRGLIDRTRSSCSSLGGTSR